MIRRPVNVGYDVSLVSLRFCIEAGLLNRFKFVFLLGLMLAVVASLIFAGGDLFKDGSSEGKKVTVGSIVLADASIAECMGLDSVANNIQITDNAIQQAAHMLVASWARGVPVLESAEQSCSLKLV